MLPPYSVKKTNFSSNVFSVNTKKKIGLISIFYFQKVNIAREKPTYQLHPYIRNDHRFDASNAVDGLTSDLSAFGGECVVSKDNHSTAIWWVNLTSIHSIHHITIFYRTDNTNYGMLYVIFLHLKVVYILVNNERLLHCTQIY